MSYGSLAVAQTAAPGGSTTLRQVKLDKECELRVEVGPDAPLRLRLLNGTAEIFGTEIPPEIWLSYPPRLKFAVFTWYGATIEMDGSTETDYTTDETPMISYVNVHAVLDARRNCAKAAASDSDTSQVGSKLLLKSMYGSSKTIEIGRIESLDPSREVGKIQLGKNWCDVRVNVGVEMNEELIRPLLDCTTIGEAIGRNIAWPLHLVLIDEE